MENINYKFKAGSTVWCLMDNRPKEGTITQVKIVITADDTNIGYFVNSNNRMEFKQENEIGSTKEELVENLKNLD